MHPLNSLANINAPSELASLLANINAPRTVLLILMHPLNSLANINAPSEQCY